MCSEPGRSALSAARRKPSFSVAIGDAVLMWRRTRRKVEAKFGHAEKGDAWYAIMRAFQMRRTRMPKPQVGRGEHPA